MKQSFTADEIKDLAAKGYTVHLMAQKLNADETALEEFYIDCSAKDSASYPLRLLATSAWLQEKLKTTHLTQLSRELKVNISTVYRLLNEYGLENPKLPDILTPEVLYSLYVTQKLTDREIAEKYNCSVDSVKKLKARYSISASDRNQEADISLDFFSALYCRYGFSFAQIAKMLNCSRSYVVSVLRPRFTAECGEKADDLNNRGPRTVYSDISSLLMKAVEPTVLLELLREYPYVKVAEMYNIIPKADKDMELFSNEWIEYWIQRMNQKQISEQFHIGYSFVSSLRKQANIPMPDTQNSLDIELIRKLYLENEWSDEKIAKMLNTNKYSIIRTRKDNGISKSDRLPLNSKLTQEEFEKLYLVEQLTLAQIAALYGVALGRISNLRHLYGKKNPEILTHKALGVSEQRMEFLKKRLRFAGLK